MKSPLPLLLAALCLLPGSAAAYTVLSPGELLRMDALIAWEAGEEVLLLSPVVRGGGTLVLPLPEGARLLPTRPEAADWLGLAPPPQTTEEEDAAAEAGGVIEDGRTLGQGLAPRATRAAVGDREAPRPADALGAGLSPDAGPAPIAAAGKIFVVPADRLGAALESVGTPRPAAEVARLLGEAPMVLVAALPRDPVALRVAPIAVGLDSVWPRIPLAGDPKAGPHPLSLRLLAAGPVRDLGGMDFAFGLEAGGLDDAVPVSLLAWLEEKVERPDRGWRGSRFVAGAMDTRKASAAGLLDLRLPPPFGAKTKRPALRPNPSQSPTAKEPPAASPPDSCEGCSSTRSEAALAGGPAFAGLLLLGLLSRRRSRP